MGKITISENNVELVELSRMDSSGVAFEKGTSVEVIETWYKVRVNGREGYVPGKVIHPHDTDMPAEPSTTPPLPSTEPVPTTSPINIEPFQGASIKSNKPIECDLDFHPALSRMDGYAQTAGVVVFVTHSLRHKDRQPSGAIVPPAKRSNHLVGHAIDMNLYMGRPTNWFNSQKLKRGNLRSLPAAVRTFIEMIRDDDLLRWGGDFIREDPVHVDDNLYRRAPDIWMRKFEAL